MNHERSLNTSAPRQVIFLAGLAGGLAEAIWVAGYGVVSGVDGWQVARAIAMTFFSNPLDDRLLVMLGIAVHFTLSLGLAFAFAYAISDWLPRGAVIATAVATLAVVWVVNFLVLLPIANPDFVTILPAPVSLSSKLLFGVAMGWTFLHLSCRTQQPGLTLSSSNLT